MHPSFTQITTTFSTEAAGLALARLLLQQRLVACAQLSGPLTSCYEFEGRSCEEKEFQLHLKTRTSLYPQVEAMILANHPYQVPQITAILLTHTSPDYRDWILTQTH